MTIARFLALALAYFGTGWLGLQIPYTGSHITLIWLPTGIAVAALLRWGTAMWPAIAGGAFLVNLAIGSAWPLALAIAVGNTLAPLAAVACLRRAGFHPAFDRQRDVALFIAGAGLGMTLSASGGVASLAGAGLLPAAAAGGAWLTWWLGDTVGVLLAAPLLLTISRHSLRRFAEAPKELLLWHGVAAAVAWFAFMQDYAQLGRTLPLAFLTLPLIAWVALRFGISGAAVGGLAFSVVAAFGTAAGHGTFSLPDEHLSLFLLWAYMTTSVLTGLLIAALQAERQHSERVLRESEEKLRGLFDLSPLGIALTDMEGHYLEFNEAFRRITGYPADELRDLDYWALTPKRYAADEVRQLQSLAETGHYGPYEKEYLRRDGRLVPLRLNGMLVSGGDGRQQIWSIVEDITESRANQQRLEKLLAEQAAMLENDLIGIVKVAERRIVWTNPAFEQMLGYGPGELAGAPTRQNYPSEAAYLDFGAAAYPVLAAGKVYRAQIEHRRKDGQVIWVDISGAMMNAERAESLWCFNDITERQRAEQELIRAKRDAEAANVAKSRFLATISHEIRTPMNGILGMAQLLMMAGLDEDERREYTQIIIHSGETLLTLLNDILDLSKVEAGRVVLESRAFAPELLIDEVATLFAEPAKAKGLRLATAWHGRPGASYRADPTRLRQMLANLVSNAIKFTAGGEIRIEGRTEAGADDCTARLEFVVSDTGIGIAEDKFELLFKPFSQIDASTTREYGGTGLGLSIVSSLAELMGGEVGVSSRLGEGSQFRFTIPVPAVAGGEEGLPGCSPAADKPPPAGLAGSVLVVEDNPTNRRVIEVLLKQLGLDYSCVDNGEEAVRAIASGAEPGLLLMDCQMPVMDGFAATAAIRRWEAEHGQPRRPIVALTAGAFEDDRERCLAAGMDDYLSKPVCLAELAVVLGKWLSAAEAC